MIQTSNNTNSVQQLSHEVIGALADTFGKSPLMIRRWIEKMDDRLISDKAREVFKRKGIDWDAMITLTQS
jgi:hypothetical protein